MPTIAETPEHTGRPEEDAIALLTAAWAPRYPEATPAPVDPVQIAQELGIIVYEGILDEDVSGMFVKRPGDDPRIYLNTRHGRNRRRFTCAHEIGHYVRRAASDDDNWEDVLYRGPRSAQGTDREEVYANKFAAALLMPAAAVRQLHLQGYVATAMAVQFEVSVEAMRNRLDNLGLPTR